MPVASLFEPERLKKWVTLGEVLGRALTDYLAGGWRQCPRRNDIDISADIERSIRYTKYDNMKNGAFRARAKRSA